MRLGGDYIAKCGVSGKLAGTVAFMYARDLQLNFSDQRAADAAWTAHCGHPVQNVKVSTLSSLTGIRAFAALWVVLYHYIIVEFMHPEFGLATLSNGHYAVDLFFILSGFILSYNYYDKLAIFSLKKCFDFMEKRFARLYPIHIICFLLSLGMYILLLVQGGKPQSDQSYSLFSAVLNILMLQSWWPGLALNWNFVSWSISAEWFAYSVIFLFALNYWRRWPMSIRFLVVVGLAIWNSYQEPGHWVPLPLLRISYGFLLGVLIYNFKPAAQRWCLTGRRIDLLLTAVFALVFALVSLPALASLLVFLVPLFGLMIGLLACNKGVWVSFFSLRPVVYLGEISYSLYMFHGLIYKIALQAQHRTVFFQQLSPWSNLLLWTIVSQVVAGCAYRWLELPGRTLILRQFANIRPTMQVFYKRIGAALSALLLK